MSISAQCLSVSPATMPDVLALANDSLRIVLGVLDELLDAPCRYARIDHQHQREASNSRHCGEVLHRIVAHVPHQERCRGQWGVGRHQQRMSVRSCMRDVKRGQRAVCSRTVLDNDILLERNAQRRGEDATNGIAGAAGTEYVDEGDRLAWIAVRARPSAKRYRCG